MKTEAEIKAARSKLCECLATPGLNTEQRATLAGLLNALVWAAGQAMPSNPLNRIMAGEPIAPGIDPTAGNERLANLPKIAGRE